MSLTTSTFQQGNIFYLVRTFFILFFAPSIYGQSHSNQTIDSLLLAYSTLEQFSGVALVAQEGTVIHHKAYGFADKEWKTKNTIDTKFSIGSITKQFTALLIMKQLMQGTIALDDAFGDYYPNYPNPIKAQITIRHLLNHRSGLPHYDVLDDFLEQQDRLSYSKEEYIKLFADKPLEFEPGNDYSYSSLNYFILGIILEKVTGKAFADLLKQHIFVPANMQHSHLDDHYSLLEKRASSYRYDYSKAEYINANYRDPSTTFSTGGIITTAEDLFNYEVALTNNQLLLINLEKIGQ